MLNRSPVFSRCGLGIGQLGADVGGQFLDAADHAETDVVLEERRQLEPQIALEQHHQRADFGRRTLPVLDRERIERQHLEPDSGRRFDDVAHGVDAGRWPSTRGKYVRRPSGIPVHDDGDVSGQPIGLDLTRQRRLGAVRRDPGQQVVKAHGLKRLW